MAQTTFTPLYGETVNISGTVDSQTVYIELPVVQGAPGVTGITPPTGINATGIAITDLAGSSFTIYGTTVVRLMRAGHANITATGVTVVSPAQITCTLPVTHAEAGAWDVVVVNPDGQEGVLPGGFTITGVFPTPVPTTPVPIPPVPVPTYNQYDTGSGGSDFPSSSLPLMTVEVNIGGDSKAWQAIVTGTNLRDLIVTGTVQPGSGSNLTPPPGTVFQYFSLVPARYASITRAVINFTVPQSWLGENRITAGSIVLHRQTANGWEALPTTVRYTKDGTGYFSAVSPGFRHFAIAGTSGEPKPPVVPPTQVVVNIPVQEQAPVPTAVVTSPVPVHTTALPAAAPQPSAQSPLLDIVLVVAALGALAGGGFMVRRWWIRRQNPGLFEDN
jgi:hypothetical protein